MKKNKKKPKKVVLTLQKVAKLDNGKEVVVGEERYVLKNGKWVELEENVMYG